MIKSFWQNSIIFILALTLTYLLFHQANAGLVSSFSDQLSSQTIATAANHTITFTTSSDFGPGDTLEIFFESGFDLSEINYTDIDLEDDGSNKNLGVTPGSGVNSSIGVSVAFQTITFIQNDTDTIAAGSVISIKIGTHASHQVAGDQHIYNPEVADTYKISISGSFGDMGTISIQVLTTDTVGFKATIEPSISFALRNAADTGSASGCNFGTVSKSIVSECSYRLAAETNNPKGFQLWVSSDGALRNDNYSIAGVAENQVVTAGTEGFGLALTAASGLTEAGDFNDDDTPVPVGNSLLISSNLVYNYIEGDLSTSSLITLKLAVSSQTGAGSYSQQITYSILGNY